MSKKILQLKIKLLGSQKPPIWRQVQILTDIDFQQLHAIIQGAMGWMNGHLHVFTDRRRNFNIGMPNDFGMDDMKDGRKIKVRRYFEAEGDALIYEYDFGDGWEHSIEVQKVLDAEPGEVYPKLLKGKGACPPEDCGGIGGYYHLVEAINGPKHESHEDMVEWMGVDEWDVNEFDENYAQERMLDQFKNPGTSYGMFF
jgi:hypothetical protein